MTEQEWQRGVHTQGGGYGPPPGGYGPPGGMPPGGAPPGGYGPPGGAPPGGYGPPGGMPPGVPGGPPHMGQPMAPPGGGPMMGGPPGGGGSEELRKQAKTWMIISFVSVVCCTGCFGIIGGVFCYMATTALDQGNIADAESKLKWGKIVTIVGIVLGALGTLAYTAMTVLAQMAS